MSYGLGADVLTGTVVVCTGDAWLPVPPPRALDAGVSTDDPLLPERLRSWVEQAEILMGAPPDHVVLVHPDTGEAALVRALPDLPRRMGLTRNTVTVVAAASLPAATGTPVTSVRWTADGIPVRDVDGGSAVVAAAARLAVDLAAAPARPPQQRPRRRFAGWRLHPGRWSLVVAALVVMAVALGSQLALMQLRHPASRDSFLGIDEPTVGPGPLDDEDRVVNRPAPSASTPTTSPSARRSVASTTERPATRPARTSGVPAPPRTGPDDGEPTRVGPRPSRSVVTRPPAQSGTGTLVAAGVSCLDIANNVGEAGTPVQMFACNGSTAQVWTVTADGPITGRGFCLDAGSGSAALATCTGAASQNWSMVSGSITNLASGLCLAGRDGGTADFTPVVAGACGSGTGTWTMS